MECMRGARQEHDHASITKRAGNVFSPAQIASAWLRSPSSPLAFLFLCLFLYLSFSSDFAFPFAFSLLRRFWFFFLSAESSRAGGHVG